MDKVVMITEYSLNESNGSILRVKRQVEGLKENNLNNVSIMDNDLKVQRRNNDKSHFLDNTM